MLNKIINKNILLGITGGIAAYKSAGLVRRLCNSGAKVKVVMTAAAKEFITPLTMQTVSGNIVYGDMFKRITDSTIEHIILSRWADVILIAPASANFIARFAYGFANDLLSTVCLATSGIPIAIAPAMNKNMWLNPATQENIKKLIARNVHVFGPDKGLQACGDVGPGRMLEPQGLLELTAQLFVSDKLSGKKVIITAGPTREPIDPVRYIGNFSSGKMGYALAEAVVTAGAEVILISGPTSLSPPDKTKFINVTTTNEMFAAVMEEISDCDIFIASAAVADYAPEKIFVNKIKKTNDSLTIKLTSNPDILAEVAALPNAPFTIGFAAETENLLENARAKLTNKKVDMILANEVGNGKGFGSDENKIWVLQRNKQLIELPTARKSVLARQIVEIVAGL